MKKKTESRRVRHLRRPSLVSHIETRWRTDLEAMSRDELVEAAISAAWEIKALQTDVDRLWTNHCKAAEARNKAPAARLAKDAKDAAKIKIKEIWLESRQRSGPARWCRRRFIRDMEMQKPFGVIEGPRTIEKWVRNWENEATKQLREAAPPSWQEVDLEARSEARPEIFQLLRYFPSGFFQVPMSSI